MIILVSIKVSIDRSWMPADEGGKPNVLVELCTERPVWLVTLLGDLWTPFEWWVSTQLAGGRLVAGISYVARRRAGNNMWRKTLGARLTKNGFALVQESIRSR